MTGDSEHWSNLFDEIHELAHAALTGTASRVQLERLEDLVANSDDACRAYTQYLKETVVIRQAVRVSGAASGERSDDEPIARSRGRVEAQLHGPPADSKLDRRLKILLTAAVVVACGAATFLMLGRSPADPSVKVARIVRQSGAVWAGETPVDLQAGDSLSYGRYELSEGIAQVKFPWGTEVTLEGPVELELLPDGTRRLNKGRLVAKVSPDDTGFTIETPTVTVIDLGTEFGVSTDLSGESEVHVFKGAVEARKRYGQETTSELIRLAAGEATIFGRENAATRQILYNPNRFSRAWRMADRIAGTSGDLRFVHPPPQSVAEGRTENNEQLLLFLEREQVSLPAATSITMSEPGYYTTFGERESWIPANVEVDSYLMHFDPIGSVLGQAPVTVRGSVTFDRPILGIIVRGDQLAASDAALSSPEIEYIPLTRYSDFADHSCEINEPPCYVRGLVGQVSTNPRLSPAPNDWVRLSKDRRTLTVSCTTGAEVEQLRILVASVEVEVPLLAGPPPTTDSTPYGGRPFAVGSTIEAEDFDLGGQGIAYFDMTPELIANVYRSRESVELRRYVDGERSATVVCFTRAGEWINYSVNIDSPGTYVVKAAVGSRTGGGVFRFEFGETVSTGPVVLPKSGGNRFPLDEHELVRSAPVVLPAGPQTMRVVMESNHKDGWIGDFDWFEIERVPDEVPAPASEMAAATSK